ncbi:MAG: hypothetical protein U1A27_05185 [Phycisphaerae bacterium]
MAVHPLPASWGGAVRRLDECFDYDRWLRAFADTGVDPPSTPQARTRRGRNLPGGTTSTACPRREYLADQYAAIPSSRRAWRCRRARLIVAACGFNPSTRCERTIVSSMVLSGDPGVACHTAAAWLFFQAATIARAAIARG